MTHILNWIKSIIFIIIISSFIEIIMPSGSYKKYIRLVFGLIMIVIIIKPVTVLLDDNNLFGKTYFETSHIIDKTNILDNSELLSDTQTNLIIRTYKEKVEKEIKLKISSILPDTESTVSIEMDTNTDSSGFGSIRKVYITLNEEKSNLVNVKEIEKINIDINKSNEKEVKVTNFNENEQENNIKQKLNETFGVPEENIIIYSKRKVNKG